MTGSLRGRWVAWLGFVVGIAASVAANVAHAQPTLGARLAAAFWPVCLFLAVEVLTRVEWRPGAGYAWARYLGTLIVAAVAAVMSYRHMAGLLTTYGEDWFSAHLGPLAVDGLMIVSGVALLSTSRSRVETRSTPAVLPLAAPEPGTAPAPETPAAPATDPVPVPAAASAPAPRVPARESSRTRGPGAEALMREHWQRERAAGRTPTGAELDRVAGTNDYGRKVRRALLAETDVEAKAA